MKFELKPYKYKISKEELIKDLKNVAKKKGTKRLSKLVYDQEGEYSSATFLKKFGSWQSALKEAELEVSLQYRERISDEQYFRNLEAVWRTLGRQLVYSNICKPLSKFSGSAYENRFGSWRKALEAFVSYMNTEAEGIVSEEGIKKLKVKYGSQT